MRVSLTMVQIARELIDAHANYAPIPGTSPTQYMQMTSTSQLLKSLSDANKPVLQSMLMSKTYPNIPLDTKNKVTLFQLAQQGVQDPTISWTVFQALWEELTLPNTTDTKSLGQRPPILYCADNISHLFTPSHYQIVDGKGRLQPIHSLDFTLPRHFVDHIVGAKTLPNGGIVLGATSQSDLVRCPPLEVGIKMGEARVVAPGAELQVDDYWNPLQRIDQRALDLCLDLNVMTLKGVSREDARTLIQYWAFNGLVRERIVDSWVGEKWSLSGGGILGELEKAVVRTRF
jgi:small subunit ribosomal protein S29